MNYRNLVFVLPLVVASAPARAQVPPAPAGDPRAPAPVVAAEPEAPAAVAPDPVVEPAAPLPPPAAPAAEVAPVAAPHVVVEKEDEKDSPPDKLTVAKSGFFQPGANLQVWAFASHLDDPATEGAWSSTLRIRRAELRARGEIIAKRVAYSVTFDVARLLDFQNRTVKVGDGGTGSVSVSQPPSGGSTSVLQDVSLTYLTDYADISIGQFKIPVSLEGVGSASRLYFPERAMVSRRYGDRRDLGVKAEKKFNLFGYTVGIFNGQGQNNLDTNDQKDLGARFELYPLGDSGKELTAAIVGYVGLGEREQTGTKDRIEGDLKLEKYGALLQAEYIRAWDKGPSARVEGQGFYVLAGYSFGDLQPVVRIGSVDGNVDVDQPAPDDEYTAYEFGANYYLKGHDVKLQLAGGFFDPEQRTVNTRFDLTLAAQVAF